MAGKRPLPAPTTFAPFAVAGVDGRIVATADTRPEINAEARDAAADRWAVMGIYRLVGTAEPTDGPPARVDQLEP